MAQTQLPWSVKGVSRQARKIAKDAARQSGQTIGAWLTSTIEAGANQNKASTTLTYAELTELKGQIEATQKSTAKAVTGLLQAVQRLEARLRKLEEK